MSTLLIPFVGFLLWQVFTLIRAILSSSKRKKEMLRSTTTQLLPSQETPNQPTRNQSEDNPQRPTAPLVDKREPIQVSLTPRFLKPTPIPIGERFAAISKPLTEVSESTLSLGRKIGGGGEANVFLVGDSKAYKRFRNPSEYNRNDPIERVNGQISEIRFGEYPTKLLELHQLKTPDRFVTPIAIVKDPQRKITGYLMPFIEGIQLTNLLDPRWRKDNGVTHGTFIRIMLDLYDTLVVLHASGIVIGDFKPENIIVKDNQCYIVDAESTQFGSFKCLTFTEGYVDPLLVKQIDEEVTREHDYVITSDWFAYA